MPGLIRESTASRAVNAGVELASCSISLFAKLITNVVPAIRWAFCNGFQFLGISTVVVIAMVYFQRQFDLMGLVSCFFKPELCVPMTKAVEDL